MPAPLASPTLFTRMSRPPKVVDRARHDRRQRLARVARSADNGHSTRSRFVPARAAEASAGRLARAATSPRAQIVDSAAFAQRARRRWRSPRPRLEPVTMAMLVGEIKIHSEDNSGSSGFSNSEIHRSPRARQVVERPVEWLVGELERVFLEELTLGRAAVCGCDKARGSRARSGCGSRMRGAALSA